MKIQDFVPLQVSQYQIPPELQGLFAAFLEDYNRNLDEPYRALQNNLTPVHNMNQEERIVFLSDDTEQEIELQKLKGKAIAVVIAGSENYEYARLAWRVVDLTRIAVKVKWDVAPTTPQSVTLWIFGS